MRNKLTRPFVFVPALLVACGGTSQETTQYEVTSQALVHGTCAGEPSVSLGDRLTLTADAAAPSIAIEHATFSCAEHGDEGELTCEEDLPNADDAKPVPRRLHVTPTEDGLRGRLEMKLPTADACDVAIEFTAVVAEAQAVAEDAQGAGTYCPDVRDCQRQHRQCLRDSGYDTACDTQYVRCIGGPFGRFTGRNITSKIGPLDFNRPPLCYRFRKYSMFHYEADVRIFDRWFDGRCVRERTIAQWHESKDCWDKMFGVCGDYGSKPSPSCPF